MITYKIFSSVSELPSDWDKISKSDIFLQSSYLTVLERACPNTFCCFFVGVFKNQELVGIALIQRVELYAKDMFRSNGATAIKKFFRNTISLFLKGHILVLGNLTHTGQHGYQYDSNKITLKEYLETILKVFNELKQDLMIERSKKVRLFLLKDFFENDPINQFSQELKALGFVKAKAQPNMILSIDELWKKPLDYINAKTKKYKKRYKTARKKLNVNRKELNLSEIEHHSSTIYTLYKNVSDNASFNTFILPQRHFCSMKEHLGERFKLFGYFFEGKLIGFYTLIENNPYLETYFLGYDEEHQYSNQLYLNMLYDMAEYSILNNFKSVVYARTAIEIKSSVGAKPIDMIMYLKHTNGFMNSVMHQVYNFMNPKRDWQERNPFGIDE